MKRLISLVVILSLGLFVYCEAQAERSDEEMIATAESAAPEVISTNAAIKTMDGRVLREGSNGWTCYPGNAVIGPMCNEPQWDTLVDALMKKETPEIKEFSVSYMLAGEGDALGASNIDPFAAEPTDDNDWIKEGPHLMIIVPDVAAFEGLSTDPKDPVYVMWKGTPYAHIMVRIATEDAKGD